MRRTIILTLPLVLLFLASVTVHAAIIQLPKTGQTACYDSSGGTISCAGTGQDGDKNIGVAWPVPRFTNYSSTVTDNLTGLMWMKDDNPSFSSPYSCTPGSSGVTYVKDGLACLNSHNYLGYSDWRMPNIIELQSLADFSRSAPIVPAGGNPFNIHFSNEYWTSTAYGADTTQGWVFGITDSSHTPLPRTTTSRQMLFVRGTSGPSGNSTVSLPKTGQSTSYFAGDDGSIKAGAAWPVPRHVDHSDGTVTDNLTGLMWTTEANTPGQAGCGPNTYKTWQQALDYVACLNSDSYLTYNDWRLPNVLELVSLIDYSVATSPPLPSGHPFQHVLTTTGKAYWTATSYAGSPSNAFAVSMVDGSVSNTNVKSTSNSHMVWPVRGPASQPIVGVAPASYDFGLIAANATSSAHTFTISNSGTGSLVVSSISITGDYVGMYNLVTGTCGSTPTIAPGASCTVTVAFAPTATGSKPANLRIASNDTTTPTKDVGLTGVGAFVIGSTVVGGNGTISCDSPVAQGSNSVCTISPSAGYHLATFTDNSADKYSSVSGNSYTISNVQADHAIQGTFGANSYTVNFSFGAHGSLTGTTPQTPISYGASTTAVTAVPAAGYHLVNWTGTGGFVTSTSNPLTVTNVTANMTITANFALNFTTSLVSSTGSGTFTCSGTVSGSPYTGGSCTALFDYGTNVTIQQSPASGSIFAGWEGACSGTAANCTVVADGSTVYAGFITSNTLGGIPKDGNLSVTMKSDGRMDIYRFTNNQWQNQMFEYGNGVGKGSLLYLNGTAHAFGYFSGNAALPTLDTANTTRASNSQYRSVWNTTSGVAVTQTVTYQPDAAYYGLRWDITNNGSASLSNLRFFHGEDTYFLGNDHGAGFWDAANTTIGVQRTIDTVLKRMSLQGVTTPYAYESRYYGDVYSHVNAFALTNTLDTNESTDNGYALEWRSATLAAGATWSIMAYEKFADVVVGNGIFVSAPVTAQCAPGGACILAFTVTNAGGSNQNSISLAAATDHDGWTATVAASVAVAAGASQQVNVTLNVPANASYGTIGHVTLTANATVSDTASVTVLDSTAPTVTAFSVPATSSSLTILVTTFTATDNVGVTGYLITTTSTPPVASNPAWSATAPTGYTVGSVGSSTLYAWAKDAAGNVSSPLSTTVQVAQPLNGACGGSNGQVFTVIPVADLCSSGSASAVSGSGPWNWTCSGENGGSDASCSAGLQTYVVTPSAGTGGSISPATPQTVGYRATAGFTVTPSSGYGIAAVTGCGGTLAGTTYTTGLITGNCTVLATFASSLSITTASLGAGSYGAAYSQSLQASGGTAPYTWAVTGGTLPPGLTLAGGTISGTPTQPGSYSLTLKASDSATLAQSTTQAYTIAIGKAVLIVTAQNANRAYGAANPALTATYSGFVNSDTPAVVSGTASVSTTATTASPAGSYDIIVGQGTLSATNYSFSFVKGTLAVNKAVLVVTGQNVSRVYGVSNPVFSATYTGFVNSDTPAVVSGTPSVSTSATTTSPAGNYDIIVSQGTLNATNYSFSFVKGTLTVTGVPLTVATSTVNGGVYGRSYSQQLLASGGAPPYTWSVSSGSLPSGLTLSGDTIIGIPTQTGSATFSIQVRDSAAVTAGKDVSVTIDKATLTVTAVSTTKSAGSVNPALTVSYSGLVNNDTAAVLSGSPAIATTATTSSPAGSYAITVSQGTLAAANYVFSFVGGTLSISDMATGPDGKTIAPIVLATASGSQVSISAGTLLTDAAGNPVSGPLTMNSTFIGAISALPSGIASSGTSDGASLVSLAASIDLTFSAGGATVKNISPPMVVTLPVPAAFAAPGTTVQYYSFDGTKWINEGSAVVKADGTVDILVGHLSIWAVGSFKQLPKGDVNSDGKVDLTDAMRVMRIAAGLITPTANDLANGDVAPLVDGRPSVTRKGYITAGDATVVMQKALGIVNW